VGHRGVRIGSAVERIASGYFREQTINVGLDRRMMLTHRLPE
jgi:hypothetical protein